MRIESIHIENQSQLMRDYRKRKHNIMQHFDYTASFNDLNQRVSDLQHRKYDREQLANSLYQMNKQWGAPESSLVNIERLRDDQSLVVIGGQQAGVLTGPLYSVNKLISIIQFAKQQEEKLQIPVIPVFWIAGEDHDFDEINHVFMQEENRMKKHTLNQRITEKRSVSQIPLEEDKGLEWLNQVFGQLHESEYTKDLYDVVKECYVQSESYVDFFARLILKLFPTEGVVLIDSADLRTRDLETDYFLSLIDNQEKISEGVYTSVQKLNLDGYSIALECDTTNAHLFYHQKNERILLNRNEAGDWVGKQNEVKLSTEELRKIAVEQPELLSNNVVTRPLMQELLFPTLAFIGGPGEISYWSVLKPAFHALDIKMPPVIPRLSFTYIDRKVEKLLTKYYISPQEAINNGVDIKKVNWLKAQSNPPIEKLADELKQYITEAHQPLRELSKSIRSDLGDLAEKNLFYLHRDIEFLQRKIVKALEEKYEKELLEFDLLNNILRPMGELQERIWNPLPFLNEYGLGFIHHITIQSYSFENEHYIVFV
ncbi:bacillithiol biosynthesis cysteine-adding enzyme BshC [Ornithinibacillus sp. L9]|uniref:Putative cysteine ligase BshC n=1 Tax=Ornithinibacillus caprae TaxID=2678566 RepID=A0A6N8FIW1_9BACI|nr:bacillithiol biosynthesis cysteine-adding enzyme BshC [Ornithinibacillus caprae]MUK89540.1 bacillithiol biosynthesis cysteine-adding enzyme BshC [Ornithinibacillus caprae]